MLSDAFEEFLTLGAYGLLDADRGGVGEVRAVPMDSPDPERPQGDPLRSIVAR